MGEGRTGAWEGRGFDTPREKPIGSEQVRGTYLAQKLRDATTMNSRRDGVPADGDEMKLEGCERVKARSGSFL